MDEGSLCSRLALLGLVEQKVEEEEELESQDGLQALVGQLVTKGPGADKPKKKSSKKKGGRAVWRDTPGRHTVW